MGTYYAILAAVVGIVVGLSAGFAVFSMASPFAAQKITNEAAGKLAADWLAANDMPATVLAVLDQNGIYRAIVKLDETGDAGDVFITYDGQLLFTAGVADVANITAQLVARKGFFDCLAAKGLKFYGSTEYNSTLLQLQILGGNQFIGRIYVPCEGEQVSACLAANVTEVPTFVYDNKTYTGVKSLDWFTNLTGCSLE